MTVLRQAWWAPIAGLLAAVQLVFAPISLVTDGDFESRFASFAIFLVGGAFTAIGLLRRPGHRKAGNVLLLIGCVFAAFWIWTIYLPVAAFVVAAGVLFGGWHPEPTESGRLA
jgi:hypothetical protein